MTLHDIIFEKRGQLIEELARLVEVNSVRTEPRAGMPFGPGGAAALAAAAEILSAHGYRSVNYDNYALEADFGDAPELMLLAHLDVVPAGDGWTKPPFRLTLEGDTAYGRGTTDDKGAALACLYAMDACRALYGEPKTGVRLVLGSGEETGSEDMDHYFSRRPKLPYTLSPDADYPLINIEKGRFAPMFTKKTDNTGRVTVSLFEGGDTQNIVPGKARAVVSGLTAAEAQESAARIEAETGVRFSLADTAEGLEIRAEGVSAHAASPEKGKNAQTGLIKLLCALPLSENGTRAALAALEALFPFGETDGASAGVKISDAVSGALTLNFGVLRYAENEFTCGTDLRCPVCADGSGLEETFLAAIAAHGFAYVGEPKLRPAHYVPAESRLVRTCLSVYEACTGEKGACLAIGGGTYVHGIEGGVAFGIEFPGRDYRIHGADEFADIGELLLTAEMYAMVIRALCYGESAYEA